MSEKTNFDMVMKELYKNGLCYKCADCKKRLSQYDSIKCHWNDCKSQKYWCDECWENIEVEIRGAYDGYVEICSACRIK